MHSHSSSGNSHRDRSHRERPNPARNLFYGYRYRAGNSSGRGNKPKLAGGHAKTGGKRKHGEDDLGARKRVLGAYVPVPLGGESDGPVPSCLLPNMPEHQAMQYQADLAVYLVKDGYMPNHGRWSLGLRDFAASLDGIKADELAFVENELSKAAEAAATNSAYDMKDVLAFKHLCEKKHKLVSDKQRVFDSAEYEPAARMVLAEERAKVRALEAPAGKMPYKDAGLYLSIPETSAVL